MIELTPEIVAGIPKNGPTDPIEYYRRPLVGWLFRERINLGLRMLPERRFARGLEIGYAAGALQMVLAPHVDELHGLDLDADPVGVRAFLAQRGFHSNLIQGNVYELPYADGRFDLAFCFSVFEHLAEYPRALREMARVLQPGGLFLLGMPRVDVVMGAGFRAIGFKGIDGHHVTTPADVVRGFAGAGFKVLRENHLELPLRSPLGIRLYNNWLLERV